MFFYNSLCLFPTQEEIGQALSNLETTTGDQTLEYSTTKDPALTGGGGGLLDQSGTTSTRSTSLSTDIPDNARTQLTANEQVLSNEQLRESGGRATGESLSPRDVNANRAGLTTVSGDPSSTQDTTGSKRILQTVVSDEISRLLLIFCFSAGGHGMSILVHISD